MSEIKALDKLRESSHLDDNKWTLETGEVVNCFGSDPNDPNAVNWGEQWRRIADEIEREIQERYLLLPEDADGVPIHVGDVMAMADGREGTVVAVGESQFTIHVSKAPNVVCQAKMHHHVKPRTLEDVLCDMIHEYGCTDALTETIADKYADEIRELLGGDAE